MHASVKGCMHPSLLVTECDRQPTYESIHVDVSHMPAGRSDAAQLQAAQGPRARSLSR